MRKILLIGGLCSAIFLGCNTPRAVENHYNRYRSEHREKFAADCSENFRPQPEYIRGKDSTIHDTTFLPGQVIDCPEPDPKTGKPGKIVCPPCPQTRKVVYRTDTVKIPDVAKETELRLRAERLQNETDAAKKKQQEAEADRDSWKGKAKTRFWIIIGICIVAIGTFILKLKKIF